MNLNSYNMGLKRLSSENENEELPSRGSDEFFALKQLSSASPITFGRRKRRHQLVKFRPADSKWHVDSPTLRPNTKKYPRKASCSNSQLCVEELRPNSKNSISDSSIGLPEGESSQLSTSLPRPFPSPRIQESTLPAETTVDLCSSFSMLSTFSADLSRSNPSILKVIRRPVAIHPTPHSCDELSSRAKSLEVEGFL
mmetsp:Transcript_13027/g.20888  ORF Transcript_13027/g.20888 Transcript_13027/m.20888 type:complete len:197 (+) Transcript_13027:153-743(+)